MQKKLWVNDTNVPKLWQAQYQACECDCAQSTNFSNPSGISPPKMKVIVLFSETNVHQRDLSDMQCQAWWEKPRSLCQLSTNVKSGPACVCPSHCCASWTPQPKCMSIFNKLLSKCLMSLTTSRALEALTQAAYHTVNLHESIKLHYGETFSGSLTPSIRFP